jgi:hypothetical protein
VRLGEPAGSGLLVRLATAQRWLLGGEPFRGVVEVTDEQGAPVNTGRAALELEVEGRRVDARGALDERGRWDFALAVPPTVREAAPALLSVRAAAADGRGGWSELVLPAAAAPARLSVESTGPGLVAGVDNKLVLAARRPDGQALRTVLDITFNDLGARLPTDSEGRAALTVAPTAGPNALVVRARVDQQTVELRRRLPALPAPGALWLQVEPERAAPGESVVVRVQSPDGAAAGPCYLDLVAGGQTVATPSVNLARGRGQLVLRLPEQASGRLALRATMPQPGGHARRGAAWLTVEALGALKVGLARSPDRPRALRVTAADVGGAPTAARVLVAAVPHRVGAQPELDPPRPAPQLADPLPSSFGVATSSFAAAHERALATQRRFFRHSPLWGGVLGGLLLAVALLWVLPTFTDPLEYVARAERRRWGRVPHVHRRGLWAGYGTVAAALLLAVMVAGGMGVMGRQAKQLADAAREPAGDWLPALGPWPAWPAGLLREGVATALPDEPAPIGIGAARVELLATGSDGEVTWTPPGGGPWRLCALGLSTAGAAGESELHVGTTPRLSVSVPAPSALRVGDRLNLPVAVANPLDVPLTVAVRSATSDGLRLETPPERKVVLSGRGVTRLDLGLTAVAWGGARLSVIAESPDASSEAETSIDVLPAAPRAVRGEVGRAGGTLERDFTVPVAGPPGLLTVHVTADPLHPYDAALARVVEDPACSADEAVAQAAAAALRCRLAGREVARQRGLDQAAARAWQRVLTLAAPGKSGRFEGEFARAADGVPDRLLTARALEALRALAGVAPVDAEPAPRIARWLSIRRVPGTGFWPPEQALPGIDQPDAALRVSALALATIVGVPGRTEVVERGTRLLVARLAETRDACTLALGAQALLAADQRDPAREVLARLARLADARDELVTWYSGDSPTVSGATGLGAALETTALAVSALHAGGGDAKLVQGGARWLARQVRPDGAWGGPRLTTTVVHALTTVEPTGPAVRGRVKIELDGKLLGQAALGDGAGGTRLTAEPGPGRHRLRISYAGRGRPAFRWELAAEPPAETAVDGGLSASVSVDRAHVAAHSREPLTVTLRVRHTGRQPLPAVAVRLPLPPGFASAPDSPGEWVSLGTLAPGAQREVRWRLLAQVNAAQVNPPELVIRAGLNPGRDQRLALPRLTVGG